jgi:trehalose/maltose transport system substrate-binding protein
VTRQRPRRPAWALGVLLLSACSHPAPQSRVITFVDFGPWVGPDLAEWHREALERFTRETGIVVKLIPGPESFSQQLETHLKLLQEHSSTPDVFAIEAAWPGSMAEHLLDLNPVFAKEAKDHFPALVANYTVNGRLVALPYRTGMGVLFYRTDLLRKYGYPAPPSTWDELEEMARNILAKERAKGNASLWGFVWPGVADESLTWTALEWQASEGGGVIVEPGGTVSINNPHVVRALVRAAAWVGTISPPGTLAYRAWDAQSMWLSGNAVFMRDWPLRYIPSQVEGSPVRDKFDVAPLPRGRAGRAHTLGGHGLGVSRYSHNPKDAETLVRYLCSREIQRWRSRVASTLPTLPALYEDAELLAASPLLSHMKRAHIVELVARPAAVTGTSYDNVSRAYYTAVHAVLAHEKTPEQAVAEVEAEVVRLTGFRTGPPTPMPPGLVGGQP